MSNTTITEMAGKTGLSPETLKSALIAGRLKGGKVNGRWEFTMEAFFEAALAGRFMPKGKFDERNRIANNVIAQAKADDKWRNQWIDFATVLTNDTIERVKADRKEITHRLPSYHTTMRELASCLNFSIKAVSYWVRKGKIKKVGTVMSNNKCVDLFGQPVAMRTTLLSLDSFFKSVESGKIQFIGRGKRNDNWRAEMVKALQETAKLDPNNAERWLSLSDVVEGAKEADKRAKKRAKEDAKRAKLESIKNLDEERWQKLINDINGESR